MKQTNNPQDLIQECLDITNRQIAQVEQIVKNGAGEGWICYFPTAFLTVTKVNGDYQITTAVEATQFSQREALWLHDHLKNGNGVYPTPVKAAEYFELFMAWLKKQQAWYEEVLEKGF